MTQAVDLLLERALERGASDIHVEPRERNVVVRYRIDGLLQEAAKFPLVRLQGVAKQIKARAGLSLRNGLPQHGSAEYTSSLGQVVLDITTMPTVNGEKLVVHLKPLLSEAATLSTLGYWGDTLKNIEYAVAEPHGLVLSSSPDKTSVSISLLAMVRELNNPAFNVTTLESPIAQRVSGVTQTELKPGDSFGAYLQAVLKQDPNVVMLNSLQDPASVSLSVQAALNGRLMLGGVHASNSAEAVHHILHLHPEPYMVAAALKVVLSQHFVRKLCLHCRQTYLPKPAERRKLSKLLAASGIKTVQQIQELELHAIEHGLGPDGHGHLLPLATTEKRIAHLWKADPHGCRHCHFSGYFGRLGVTEAMLLDEHLRQKVAKGASSAVLHQAAVSTGMLPLQLDGFVKALRGLTSIEEVLPLMHKLPKSE